jgi:cyclase
VSSSHDDGPGLAPPFVSEVAEGVFAYVQPDGSWWINNTGFLAGSSVVLSIDSCSTERRTRDYLSAVQATVGRLPTTLVNTHHHGDHTNGNCLFETATIIGHHNCRAEMLRTGILRPDGLFEPVEWGELVVAPPTVTFDQRLTVYVNDLAVELIHLTGPAHTTNDVVAWIPSRGVLFSGDLVFNGGTPFVLMGSVAGSLEALDCIYELEPEIIVPGHGDPCTLDDVAIVGEYLRTVQTHATAARAEGLAPLEAARAFPLEPFAHLHGRERLAGNLHRAYAELEGIRPGHDIDYLSAFADMVTMNGGKPLPCRA